MHTVVESAIKRSVVRNEIATIDLGVLSYDSRIQTDLVTACDDWSDAGSDLREFWGLTSTGEPWRVRLQYEASEPEPEPEPADEERADDDDERADYDV